MSSGTHSGEFTGVLNSPELSDQDWLSSQTFRRQTSETLAGAAADGDVVTFIREIQSILAGRREVSRRRRQELEQDLKILWSSLDTSDTSAAATTDAVALLTESGQELSPEEFSARIESLMAGLPSREASLPSILVGLWILQLEPTRLEGQTFFSLWRWTREGSRNWLAAQTVAPDQGCDAFDSLEVQALVGWVYSDLKGEHKSARKAVKGLQQALDAATDQDGTPQARWLSEIISRLCQLARIHLFAEVTGDRVWTSGSKKRLQRLFARIAALITPAGASFIAGSTGRISNQLECIARVLEIPLESGVERQLRRGELFCSGKHPEEQEEAARKQFQKPSRQSDWGEWAVLRSSWCSPVDHFAVTHHGPTPLIDAIAADVPLFSGEWSHSLSVNGLEILPGNEWTCCCWYLDKQTAYIELQLKETTPVQVIRQALLMRRESVLIVGDSVRLSQPGDISFQRRLPLVSGWDFEQDAATRELALIKDEQRVRLFPWSSPQLRTDHSPETTSIRDGKVELDLKIKGSGFYTSTLFDWSEKRRDQPVDWQRLTVAEDGQILRPDVAAAFRLRLGKKQWVVYHSLQKPAIPRTALGIHSSNETIIAELGSDGEPTPLVEVEL